MSDLNLDKMRELAALDTHPGTVWGNALRAMADEMVILSAELNSAWKHAQLLTADRNLWRANSDTANAALRAGMANRATEHARHSQAYVNVDDGYPWLTCGECDELLFCIDGGDRLDTLTQAVNGHECATEQSAEAA